MTVSSTTENAITPLGSIQGSNYGGHAPIVGAHVFVLQPDPAATGYGQIMKSLISGNGTSLYPTSMDLTNNSPTYGMAYVTTDSMGQFNVTGDYTCDSGYPVYLYASGGNPNAPPAGESNVNITAATITGTGPYTISFTASNLLYQGEGITFSGSGSSLAAFLNGSQQTVLSDSNLTTSSFDIGVSSLTENGVTLATGPQSVGTIVATQTSPPNNPAIMNMATLGICGDNGATNFSSLNFVFVNEVSTVATAYAMAGFFSPTSTTFSFRSNVLTNNGVTLSPGLQSSLGTLTATGASGPLVITGAAVNGTAPPYTIELTASGTVLPGEFLTFSGNGGSVASYLNGGVYSVLQETGNDAVHLSIPSGDSLALSGLQVAGRTAAQLYDIQGSNIGVSSTGANCATTPTNPICDGDAHIARAFTTYSAVTGSVPQGLLDTLGNVLANCVDSANTFNVATYPGGTPSSQCTSLFAAAKSGGQSGIAPNDTATAAINIARNPLANVATIYHLPTGNVPFSPDLTSVPNDFSVGISYTWPGIQKPQAIAVDGYGAIWITQDNSPTLTALVPYLTANSALAHFEQLSSQFSPMDLTIGPNNLISFLDVIASDGAGYVYVGSTPVGSIYKVVGTTGAVANTPATEPLTGSTACLNGNVASHMSIDNLSNGYNLWISSEAGDFVCIVNTTSTGALLHQIVINPAQSSSSYDPEVIAIDASGSAWIPNQRASTLSKITQGGVLSNPTGGTLSNPYGAAVDGAGSVFIANRGSNDISEYSNTGVAISSLNLKAGGILSDPLNLAVDLAGNLWITNYTGNKIVEMVGVAAPTYAPLAVAASVNKLGSRP